MERLKKIIISVLILGFMVGVISIFVSGILKPNQKTPIKQVLPAVPNPTNKVKLSDDKTVAAWVWQSPSELREKVDSIIEFSIQEDINTLYVYIDEYIDIYEMPEGSEKTQKTYDYFTTLRNIIKEASAKGIKVHALSGNTNYSYDSHNYIPPILLQHVFDFNKDNPDAKFEGIQFDIEFYEDKQFFDSKDENVQNYLTLVNDLSYKTKELNEKLQDKVRLGFVIPFWFDEVNEYLKQPILGDIVQSLSINQNPYLIIMSYRNVIDGKGGVLDISEDELKAPSNTSVRIIIAQELVESKDSKITHYGKSKEQIREDFNKIIAGASTYDNFEGISIHDLSAYMNLE